MLVAAGVMCVSSWIGTLAGLSGIGAVLACTVWGFLYGAVWTLSPGAAWIALQGVVWLVISTAYPARGVGALTRGSLVLAGGLLQMFFVLGFWRISGWVTPAFGGAGQNGDTKTLSNAVEAAGTSVSKPSGQQPFWLSQPVSIAGSPFPTHTGFR